ncbi:unnamed protein product [Chironomus riparius]|uniref:Uncharacterized protein n=1 Tax=Chironomus riparius TaxID=315576 RepID=A0A9N9RRE9_9DIPT|nr:unnamed protein product [Chironomus riparius]
MELMDSETGEILFQRSTNLECHNLDLETGEILEECDESEVDESQQKLHFVARKSKFNVPKALIKEPKCESNAKFDCYLSSQESFSLTNKKRVIDLKEEIIFGYNKFSHRLFLIPSFFLFPKLGAIYIIVVELVLHIWAHHKNKRNQNPKIYYRSPLDILTSQFCNFCRETKDLQDLQRVHRQEFPRKFMTASF